MLPPSSRFTFETALSILVCVAGAASAIFLVLLLGGALAGCDGGNARAAELRTLLVNQNQDLALSRPDWVENMYATMAMTPYNYLRGDAVVFYADATRDTGSSALLVVQSADLVPLFGDLHLENAGTVPAGDVTVLDSTDFDASVDGPIDWDLRRAALGIAALDALRMGHPAAGDPTTIAPAVGALYDGYARGVTEPQGAISRDQLGTIVVKQLEKADVLLATRAELADDTVVIDGVRTLQRTSEQVDVDSPWDTGLDDALAIWSSTRRAGPLPPSALVVKDVARRLDAGVSSLALNRFYALIENGPGNDDDLILEIKESRDPPEDIAALGRGATLMGYVAGTVVPDDAARILGGETQLLAGPTEEPDLGRTTWNGVAFVVRRETDARVNLDTGKISSDLDSGKYTDADFAALANDVGRLLGRAHANARPAAAHDISVALTPALRAAVISRAVEDAASLAYDYALFQALLAQYGPLLSPPLDWSEPG